jgi:ferredoxin
MTATIYYFSGTGNSLHVARTLAARCKGRLFNIAGLQDRAEIADHSEAVGLVYPVSFGSMPGPVKDFAGRLKLRGTPYVFAVVTSGAGMPGDALTGIDRLLRKNGSVLSAGFVLAMPDNAYIGMNMITPPDKREAILKASEDRLSCIADIIDKRETAGFADKAATAGRVVMPAMRTVMTRAFRLQKKLASTAGCTGCGTCEKLCPTGNISVESNRVIWGDRCTLCLACFHWCPQQAIRIGNKSEGIARYHHPAVTVEDMKI